MVLKMVRFLVEASKMYVPECKKTWLFVLTSNARQALCINPLNAELNPICHSLALLGAHHILHVSRIRVTVMGEGVGSNLSVFNFCICSHYCVVAW